MNTPSKIYLASAVEQLMLVDQYADRLKRQGFTITYEWTNDVRENSFKADTDLSSSVRKFVAKMDSRGVETADIVWILTPGHKHMGCGMWVELGLALAQKRRVVVSGPLCRRTVFTELAEFCVDDHEEAFRHICALGMVA